MDCDGLRRSVKRNGPFVSPWSGRDTDYKPKSLPAAFGPGGVIKIGRGPGNWNVARTDCRVVAVDEKRFTHLVRSHPYFALDVMRVLAERLRRRTES